jgi:hypothetical protein
MPLYNMLHMRQWQIGAPLSYSGSFLFQTLPNVVCIGEATSVLLLLYQVSFISLLQQG